MEDELTTCLGSIRTALAGPMTDASIAVNVRQSRTNVFCHIPDLLRNQTQVPFEKNSNLEKVKPKLSRPSGKPSPNKISWRMTSKRIAVMLATARSSCWLGSLGVYF